MGPPGEGRQPRRQRMADPVRRRRLPQHARQPRRGQLQLHRQHRARPDRHLHPARGHRPPARRPRRTPPLVRQHHRPGHHRPTPAHTPACTLSDTPVPGPVLTSKDVQICHKGRLCALEGAGDPHDFNDLRCTEWYKMDSLWQIRTCPHPDESSCAAETPRVPPEGPTLARISLLRPRCTPIAPIDCRCRHAGLRAGGRSSRRHRWR